MVGLPTGMEQTPEKFIEEVFRCCICLMETEDSRAYWDDGFDGRNKTTIKWFVGIENMAKP